MLYRTNEQLRTPLGDGGLMGRVGENLENMQVLAGFIQRRFADPRCVARGQEAELVGDWLSRPVLA